LDNVLVWNRDAMWGARVTDNSPTFSKTGKTDFHDKTTTSNKQQRNVKKGIPAVMLADKEAYSHG
jgi:hypothetical protein